MGKYVRKRRITFAHWQQSHHFWNRLMVWHRYIHAIACSSILYIYLCTTNRIHIHIDTQHFFCLIHTKSHLFDIDQNGATIYLNPFKFSAGWLRLHFSQPKLLHTDVSFAFIPFHSDSIQLQAPYKRKIIHTYKKRHSWSNAKHKYQHTLQWITCSAKHSTFKHAHHFHQHIYPIRCDMFRAFRFSL